MYSKIPISDTGNFAGDDRHFMKEIPSDLSSTYQNRYFRSIGIDQQSSVSKGIKSNLFSDEEKGTCFDKTEIL